VISNGYNDGYNQQQGYQQNWQQLPPYQQQQQQQQQQLQGTPYQSHNTPYQGQRHIEAPPLVHAHTMPALGSSREGSVQEGVVTADGGRTPRKRGLFR